MRNVLWEQTHDLKKGILNYIPQDHIIHSINLYILGIYIFFNSDVLSRKILVKGTQTNYYNKIKNFVLQWQVFSLYHDVGYYFEVENAKVLFSKDLISYAQLTQQIIHFSIIKHITKSLTYKALEEKSKSSLGNGVLKGIWYKSDGSKVEADKVNKKLMKYNGIDGIVSDEEFMAMLPLLDGREYLTAVYNEYEECVALIFRKELTVVEYLSKFQISRDELFVNDIIDSSQEKFKFKYFVKDIKKTEFWEKAIDEVVAIKEVCSQFPCDLNEFISLHFDDIDSILCLIKRWLINSIPFTLSNTEEAQYIQNLETCYKKSIVQNLSSLIQSAIMDEEADLGKDVKFKKIKEIIDGYRRKKGGEFIKEFKKKIEDDATKMYEQQYGSSYPFTNYYNELRKNINEQNFISQDTLLEFIDTKNEKINCLTIDEENESHKKLYSLLMDLSDGLGLELEDILNYKTPYANYDHGIMSACMLFQSALFINDLKQYCNKENLLSLSWDGIYESTDFLKQCAESIFAVMIHNIYSKKSQPKYGLPFSHDLDKNPFSYFCAFCDTLQRWGRPKLIDLSETVLPPNNFLEDEIDVSISDGSIYIQCLESNIESIQKMIQESNLFLPGISQIVKVSRI